MSMPLPKSAFVLALAMIPLIPKVKVFGVDEAALVLDDFVLLLCGSIGSVYLLSRGAVTGRLSIPANPVVAAFSLFLGYKVVIFVILGLFLPWIHSLQVLRGIVFGEGLLVIGKTTCIYACFLILLILLRDDRDARVALNAMMACIVLVVAVGLAQYFILGHDVLTSTFRHIYALSRTVPGRWVFEDPWFGPTAVGHEHFGAFMILSFALCTGMLLCGYPATRKRRYALVGLWGLCIFCLVYASSRGAWIGWLCTVGALGLWQAARGRLLRTGFYALLALVAMAAADQIWGLGVDRYIGARIEGLIGIYEGKGEIEDNSAQERIKLFKKLWGRFLERPLIGWGAGSAGRIAEGQHMRELIEGGIIGWGFFMGMMAVCCLQARKRYRASADPLVRGSNVGLITGICGLLGQSMFTELFVLTKIGVPFWLLVAILQRLGQRPA